MQLIQVQAHGMAQTERLQQLLVQSAELSRELLDELRRSEAVACWEFEVMDWRSCRSRANPEIAKSDASGYARETVVKSWTYLYLHVEMRYRVGTPNQNQRE